MSLLVVLGSFSSNVSLAEAYSFSVLLSVLILLPALGAVKLRDRLAELCSNSLIWSGCRMSPSGSAPPGIYTFFVGVGGCLATDPRWTGVSVLRISVFSGFPGIGRAERVIHDCESSHHCFQLAVTSRPSSVVGAVWGWGLGFSFSGSGFQSTKLVLPVFL